LWNLKDYYHVYKILPKAKNWEIKWNSSEGKMLDSPITLEIYSKVGSIICDPAVHKKRMSISSCKIMFIYCFLSTDHQQLTFGQSLPVTPIISLELLNKSNLRGF
jgi:hypothetical protein